MWGYLFTFVTVVASLEGGIIVFRRVVLGATDL